MRWVGGASITCVRTATGLRTSFLLGDIWARAVVAASAVSSQQEIRNLLIVVERTRSTSVSSYIGAARG